MQDYYDDKPVKHWGRLWKECGHPGAIPDYQFYAFCKWAQSEGCRTEVEMHYSGKRLTLTQHHCVKPDPIVFAYSFHGREWQATDNAAVSVLKSFCKAVDAGQVDGLQPPRSAQQPEPNQDPNSSKGNTMSEKNAAAFLRDNSRSVSVTFIGEGASAKHYTYVTTLALKKDDYVVVPARETFALAKVMNAHDTLEIDPNSDTKYRWVVAKVDFSEYNDLLTGNEKLEAILRDAYQANAKKAFRDVLMQSLGAGDKKEVIKLLGK